MAQTLVRKLPDSLVQQLKARAQRNGRSLEAEVRDVLQQAVTKEKAEFFKVADAMRARLAGRHHTETLELLRADRDR
jgi:plasmid stability protein